MVASHRPSVGRAGHASSTLTRAMLRRDAQIGVAVHRAGADDATAAPKSRAARPLRGACGGIIDAERRVQGEVCEALIPVAHSAWRCLVAGAEDALPSARCGLCARGAEKKARWRHQGPGCRRIRAVFPTRAVTAGRGEAHLYRAVARASSWQCACQKRVRLLRLTKGHCRRGSVGPTSRSSRRDSRVRILRGKTH
eukprot:3677139-Prymnesium_polylepis.1